MDVSNYILRLRSEQDRALSDTKSQLSKWQTFKDDYLAVKKKLEVLPVEISHIHMVPFGPLAMMPGELIHTNEVLVLLGDNWFVDMSARNACQLIDRRLQDIEKSIAALEKQLHLLQSRVNFTSQEFPGAASNEVDITEAYDSDTERQWKERHRENVKRERVLRQKQEKLSSKHESGDDAFQLLNALHEQELRAGELRLADDTVDNDLDTTSCSPNRCKTSSDSVSIQNAQTNNIKSVRWRDEQPTSSSSESGSSSDYDSDDSRDSVRSSTTSGISIRFKHSQTTETEPDYTPRYPESESEITNPRDLYKLFNTHKSSLKKTVEMDLSAPFAVQSPGRQSPVETVSARTAVKTSVVERMTETSICDTSGCEMNIETKPAARVSKFKARRNKH